MTEAEARALQERVTANKDLKAFEAAFKAISIKAKGKTEKPLNEKLNKTEARYAKHLERLKLAGEILWWRSHAFGLYFEDGTRYTPDFVTMDKAGSITLIDVKAYYKNQKKVHIDTASMIRMKRTAHEYYFFSMKAVWEKDGVWEEMTF